MAKKPARPYTFKLPDDAMVTFAFLDKEKAEEYYAKLKVKGTVSVKQEEKLDFGQGSGMSIGLHVNDLTKEYELVRIRYNLNTKTSEVVDVVAVGKLAHRAYDALKIALIRNGVIK